MTPLIPDPEIWAKLTPRQKQIFAALCRGWTDKQIGRELNISESTIRGFIQAMYLKANSEHTRHALIVTVCRLSPPSLSRGNKLPINSSVSRDELEFVPS